MTALDLASKQIPNDKYGAVYTPTDLAEFVAQLSWMYRSIESSQLATTVLDPACGELSLLKALDRTRADSPKMRAIGIDIDPEAISANEKDKFVVNRHVELFQADFLLPTGRKYDSAEYWIDRVGEIDLIVANPPWSSNRIYSASGLKKSGFELAAGQYDSYVLFVELSMKLLSPGGMAAFILPDSIFAGEGKGLRKLLAENYSLKVIARLGEKLFPGVNRATTVILVQRKTPSPRNKVDCFRLDTDSRTSVLNGHSTLIREYGRGKHSVHQLRFQKAKGFAFDIDARASDEELLKKIRSAENQWSSDLVFGRGVEISKTGLLVQCTECQLYQGASKIQVTTESKICKFCRSTFAIAKTFSAIHKDRKDGSVPVYVGEDIRRYAAKKEHYLTLGYPGVSYKNLQLYEAPKLLVRKTGLGINAVIDMSGSFVTQTVYVMKPKDSLIQERDLWFYGAVLNSRLILYYYLKTFGENEWKSHPYLTKQILFALPIRAVKDVERKTADTIANLARKIQTEYVRELDMKLEEMIFELYGVSASEIDMISNELSSLPNLRAFNEMKF